MLTFALLYYLILACFRKGSLKISLFLASLAYCIYKAYMYLFT